MKILISAFACNPYQGSEPGVGWAAVCRIAKKHEVFVLVDSHNKSGWDEAYQNGVVPSNVQVRFLKRNNQILGNRFLARLQSWLWYAEFNRLVLKAASDWHDEENFDLCHHVTLGTWRIASPLWNLPIPFIWGPIGGAGRIPPPFRKMLGGAARLFEAIRDLNTCLALRSRKLRKCILNSHTVIVTDEDTAVLLRPFRKSNPLIKLPPTSFSKEKFEYLKREDHHASDVERLTLFAGGNIEARKGIGLAILALSKVRDAGIPFHYIIAGGGPDVARLRLLAQQCGLQDQIQFHPGYHGDDYRDILQKSHIYLLPSFRESMGITLVEAVMAGCYPIVADTSAQGEMVRMAGGTAVPVDCPGGMIKALSAEIISCHSRKKQLFDEMAEARSRIENYLDETHYRQVIESVYIQCKENR